MRERLLDLRPGKTLRFEIYPEGGGEAVKGYATTGEQADGRLGEVFVRVGKPGDSAAVFDQWAVAYSVALQCGADFEGLTNKFRNGSFGLRGATSVPGIPRCSSVVDLVCRWLLQLYWRRQPPTAEEVRGGLATWWWRRREGCEPRPFRLIAGDGRVVVECPAEGWTAAGFPELAGNAVEVERLGELYVDGGMWCARRIAVAEARPVSSTHVVGFCFSGDLSKVVLIRKARPAWQVGKLNGVGGKIEPGEAPEQAMAREFCEETGYAGEIAWRHFCHYVCPTHESVLEFFAAWDGDAFEGAAGQDATEPIERASVEEIVVGDVDAIPNLLWLVPMARNLLSGLSDDTFDVGERDGA